MKHIERIERYWNKDMTDDELKAFEKDCENNQELFQEFAFYTQMRKAVRDKERDKWRQVYKENLPLVTQKKNTWASIFSKWWFWGLLIVIISGVIWGNYRITHEKNNTLENENIDTVSLRKFADADDIILRRVGGINVMDSKNTNDTKISKIKELVNQGKYVEAVLEAEKIDSNTENYFMVLEILGYSYAQMGIKQQNKEAFKAAKNYFNQYLEIENVNDDDRDFARWNLYIINRFHLSDLEESKRQFEAISDYTYEAIFKNIKNNEE